MGSSQYSQGSEEGEIRPKRVFDPRMPHAKRTKGSTSHTLTHRPTSSASKGNRQSTTTSHTTTHRPASSTSSNNRQSMAPPPPRITIPERAEKTLSEELEESRSSNSNKAVPAFPGYTNDPRSHDDRVDAETIRVNGPPPSANMVTASQEQRGISHGPEHIVDSDVAASSSAQAVSARKQGKQPVTEADKDPYQVQVERIERRQEMADSSYPGPSQDTPTTLYEDSVDPQDASELAGLTAAMRSPSPHHDTSAVLPRTHLGTVETADGMITDLPLREANTSSCNGCQETVDTVTMWNCMQCVDVNFCTPCYYDPAILRSSSHSRHTFTQHVDPVDIITSDQAPATTDLPSLKSPRKKMNRENHGVRHTTYAKLGEDGKRERDELIVSIRSNWPRKPDFAFWPSGLAPASEGALLALRDVSSSLLRELRPLSELTKGHMAKAHQAMNDAFTKRINETGEKRELISDDLKEAINIICSASRKRARTGTDQRTRENILAGPSTKRARRSEQESAEQPSTVLPESSATLGRSPRTPSHQLHDEITQGQLQGDSSAESPAESPAESLAEAVAGSPGQVVASQAEHQTLTPPLSPEVLSQVLKRLKSTPASMSAEISTDTDWMEHTERLKAQFSLTSLKAQSTGKGNFLITFSVGEQPADAA